MPYSQQTWADLPSTSTPISAARLDHIETGIDDVTDAFEAHEAAMSDVHGIDSVATLLTEHDQALTDVTELQATQDNVAVIKVWDSGTSAYVWLGGTTPTSYGIIHFIGPEDPATSTGGVSDDFTIWDDTSV